VPFFKDSQFRSKPTAQNLNLHTDPMGDDFGTLNWDDNWGNWLGGRVLVVRQDKKAITPRQVEAVVHFCHEVLMAINDKREKLRGPSGKVGADWVAEREKVIQD
jgi:hypothetical protein